MPYADSQSNRTRGILWMLTTMLCFISLDTIMKYLLEFYPLVQVTWARFFFATVFAAVIAGRRLPFFMRSVAPRKQLLRSVLLMSTTGMFNAGIKSTPLATGTTIMFLSPILVTLLSAPLLGERVSLRRWAGIIVGFVGATIVTRPWESGSHHLDFGVVFLLIAALFNANYQIITRMVRDDDPLTSLLFTAAAGAVVTSLMLPWHWQAPTLAGWGLLVASGVAGGLGHFCLIRALRLAPASVVAPFTYSSLIWATLFGLLIWNDWPDLTTWLGALMIIGSGLYIFYSGQAPAPPEAPARP
jgi:drug/metabolite transporter (DMT)-like permease